MATSPHQAALSAEPAPASLASLPDALLERILGLLEQEDRHHAALVSQRWHAAAHSPIVLQSISCRRFSLAQLQSITTWLLRHGLYVRSLNLFCYPHDTEAEACAWDLAASLGALAASGLLQQLRLGFSSMRTALHVTSWCSALRQLRELQLFNRRGVLRISSSLAGLSTVTGLDLIGGPVVLDAAVQLPPNVEWLCLFDDCERAELPEQLSGLTRLSTLMLSTDCPPDGFAVLARLGRLARLSLKHNEHLPACLPQLTGLCELRLCDSASSMEQDAKNAAVNAALQQMTGLTSLCIQEGWRQVPAALPGLIGLQRCCLGHTYGGEPSSLPPGPWLASLRCLAASLNLLACSIQALAAATQLTHLALSGTSLRSDAQEALWKWMSSHPSLRRVQMEVEAETDPSSSTLDVIRSLARERPALEVTLEPAGENDLLYDAGNFAI